MAKENVEKLKKVGNWISVFLLGDTRDLIIRTDERVGGLNKIVSEIKEDIHSIKISLSSHGEDIVGLKVHTHYGVSNSPTVPSDIGKKLLKDSGFDKQYPFIKDKLFTLMQRLLIF